MNTIKILDCDVIFLSYDEPNADENYSKLLEYIPWAQRVHGVKGSDAAHKACANLATTERVVIVDGDNYMVRDDFVRQIIEINDDNIDLSQSVISWPSVNVINGLIYGNGGIKCWPTDKLLTMRTHESADPENVRAQVDFCWDINYIPLDETFTEIHNNATSYQAWRAGFREGVKMSLDQGYKVDDFSKLWKGNVTRLATWMMVGLDVEFGEYSILGARQGCFKTHFSDWDYVNVRDFEYLKQIWDNEVSVINDIDDEIKRLGELIKEQLEIGDPLSYDQCKFFKRFDMNPKRQPSYVSVSRLI